MGAIEHRLSPFPLASPAWLHDRGPGCQRRLASGQRLSHDGNLGTARTSPETVPVSSTLLVMLVATSVAAIVIVVTVTAIMVIGVLGLFVWGAIQDGREEHVMKAQRRRRTPL